MYTIDIDYIVKVAYLTTYYNGEIDGRFGRFHDWIHALRDMDDPPFEFEVVALTASNPDETLSSQPYATLGEATDLWGDARNKIEFCINAPRTIQDLRQIEFDVLHVLTLDTVAYPIAVSMSNRHPIVGPDIMGYTPRREGSHWEQSSSMYMKNQLKFRIKQFLIRQAKNPTLIALSEYHAANINEVSPSSNPIVIPPGVSSIFVPGGRRDTQSSKSTSSHFLYIGDLSEYKGYYIFLNALAEIPHCIDFHATVIGNGNPDADRIKKLGLGDSVTIEGFVPRSELPEYYRRADFFVMPSIDENGPNTIVEALACGTPIIATDKPGINEYAPEGAAIYVDRTAESLRNGLIKGHERRQKYIEVALSHALNYRVEQTIDALVELYHEHYQAT